MRSVDEILKAMRGLVVNSGIHDGDMVDATAVHHAILQYADELEKAYKLERVEVATRAATQAVNLTNEKIANSPVGNAYALRDALVRLRDEELAFCEKNVKAQIGLSPLGLFHHCRIIRGIIEEALSAPPRNCDLRYYNNAPTIDECSARALVDHLRYCEKYGTCDNCPIHAENGSCLAKFLLSPAGGAK